MNVDFPNPKDLLAKKKAQKEATKAAAAEKATHASRTTEPSPMPVIESSLEPPTMPVQSPAKKRKADEKPKRKFRRKGRSWTSLLQNKSIGAGIMRQLLSDVDSEAINEGRIQSHLDELLWDGLKSNLRAMGLVYRATDKVVVQKKLVRELQEIDRERELQTVTQSSKEGMNMMKVMVDRFDEAQAKIKTLEESLKEKEADYSVLVARIVDAYERATLKARYDLRKEYKHGLLVDADVEE
ncbi:hypothetical protein TIFTF001_038211 [Ficus carica]|uniref:Uncharacterized protein n=1 Tax=Ficus carica TaxID=3494 RepID=A0AA88EA65_FICCA|nr:hypothetical protein TIFTF001_038211 [Ficus carica]